MDTTLEPTATPATGQPPETAYPEIAYPEISVAQAKRMLEWWCSSQKFRDLMESDPAQAGRDFGLGFNPEWLRPLWNDEAAAAYHRGELKAHPTVPAYRQFYNDKGAWRDRVKEECASSNPRIRAWRQRQCARSLIESGAYDSVLIHAPFAIELTDGCTVGCWFCGVGASKFAQAWPYSPEHAALWQQVLAALHERIGDAARWGFCYWATDPLDNPDYERFAGHFADEMGIFPQTTTAQAHKHLERVRQLLRVSEARGCRVNRFSVLSVKFLEQIHAAFTPEEMLNVEIVSQMPEGTVPKALAGGFLRRAREKEGLIEHELAKINRGAVTMPAEEGQEPHFVQPATIACVSGFLVNMVRGTVKLISPCAASERWPLGYIVFDERSFTTAAEFEQALDELIEAHMPTAIEPEDVVRFNPDFRFVRHERGFRLATPRNEVRFEREELAAYLTSLGEMIEDGERTAAQIALKACFEHGIPESNTLATLQEFFRNGLLVDQLGRLNGAPQEGA